MRVDNEIRVDSRHAIQPIFRVPLDGNAMAGDAIIGVGAPLESPAERAQGHRATSHLRAGARSRGIAR
jgi:hypothetical protein